MYRLSVLTEMNIASTPLMSHLAHYSQKVDVTSFDRVATASESFDMSQELHLN